MSTTKDNQPLPASAISVPPEPEGTLQDGVRETRLESFSHFFDFVQKCSQPIKGGLGLLWRGQRRAEWDIRSSLARTGQSAVLHLTHFRDAVARTTHVDYDLSNQSSEGEEKRLHLWSLGQHHGLKTPLIDWTAYPYVALFFAFEEPDPDAESRAVFGLRWRTVEQISYDMIETNGMKVFRERLESPPFSKEFQDYLIEKYFADENEPMVRSSAVPNQVKERICKLEFLRLKKCTLGIHRSPASENRRIHAQGGWHLYTPNDTSVESWIRENHGTNQMVMTKLLIPNSERKAILNALNQMNINYLTLFPDLEGAARHCNLALMECGHSGFREY